MIKFLQEFISFAKFAQKFIQRDGKSWFIFIPLCVILFVVFSVLLTSHSLQSSVIKAITQTNVPTLSFTPLSGSKEIPASGLEAFGIAQINGVQNIYGRIYGQYFFTQGNTYFTLIGIDLTQSAPKELLEAIPLEYQQNKNWAFVGSSVLKSIQEQGYTQWVNLYAKGVNRLEILGSLKNFADDSILGHNVLLVDIEIARNLLGLKDSTNALLKQYTDLAIFVNNSAEIPQVVSAIKTIYPFSKVVASQDSVHFYEILFAYENGVFLIFFGCVLLAFMCLLLSCGMQVGFHEKKAVAIMRACGWDISRIILFLGIGYSVLFIVAYFLALALSYIYVFMLNAVGLIGIFTRSQGIHLEIVWSFSLCFGVAILLYIPYLCTLLFPAWKLSITEVNEVMQ